VLQYSIGYLSRPYLWRDLARQPQRLIRLQRKVERTRPEATDWSTERAISESNAIAKLTGQEVEKDDFYRKYQFDLQVAQECAYQSLGSVGSLQQAAGLNLLYALTRHLKPQRVVETGVAAGWSSLAILLALQESGQGFLYSIDRPDMRLPRNYDRFVGAAVPNHLFERWDLILGSDRDRIPQVLSRTGKQINLSHYDSDKSYYGRLWAYCKIWEYLSNGGLLVSDDISDNLAFRDFCWEVEAEPVVVRKEADKDRFVGVIRKK
jgi:predicted O-methyltransferase YrrM